MKRYKPQQMTYRQTFQSLKLLEVISCKQILLYILNRYLSLLCNSLKEYGNFI